MNVLSVAAGIALIVVGIWLTIVKIKHFAEGKPDNLGGHISLLMCGIALIIIGIIQLING